jgi:hypothetical protein
MWQQFRANVRVKGAPWAGRTTPALADLLKLPEPYRYCQSRPHAPHRGSCRLGHGKCEPRAAVDAAKEMSRIVTALASPDLATQSRSSRKLFASQPRYARQHQQASLTAGLCFARLKLPILIRKKIPGWFPLLDSRPRRRQAPARFQHTEQGPFWFNF